MYADSCSYYYYYYCWVLVDGGFHSTWSRPTTVNIMELSSSLKGMSEIVLRKGY